MMGEVLPRVPGALESLERDRSTRIPSYVIIVVLYHFILPFGIRGKGQREKLCGMPVCR
jgi:hypothetical protein